MKRKLLLGSAIAVLAVGVWTTVRTIQFSSRNSLMLANLEALADAEYEEGGEYHIVGTSTTYYLDGIAQYTVMTRDCNPGGTMKCTRSTQTIWYN